MPQLFSGIPLYEPDEPRDDRVRFLRERIPDLDRANSFTTPAGRGHACGWIMVKRSDYLTLDKWATNHKLVIEDFATLRGVSTGTGPLSFQNLAIVQARCVSRGLPQDPNSVYLLEITDGRGVLANRWFRYPTESAYNVRAPAYPRQYYQPSLVGGFFAYTWSQIVQNLWEQMGTFLGPYPGLPSVPGGTPEGWWFPGTSCWDALCNVLDLLGFQVAHNPMSLTPYTIVAIGAADVAFTSLQMAALRYLEDDWDYVDGGSGRVPGTIVVYFHRRNEMYGTEETIRRDSLQWSMTPLFSVTVSAPAIFASAQGTAHLWSDFTVRYDVDNLPLSADILTAQAVAATQAQAYWDEIYRGTLGAMHQEYAGALPFVTGSQVDRVTWRQDRRKERRAGWVTVVERGC